MTNPVKLYGFGPARRLHGAAAFDGVYHARLKKNAGPLSLFAKPNDLPHPRLGLSVPRLVGTAVKRNRIKRLLREAFRLGQHEWPRGYDVVIVVRPHAPATLADYRRLLSESIPTLHREWERRERRQQPGD